MAVFHDDKVVFERNIKHSAEELKAYDEVTDQLPFRKRLVVDELEANDIAFDFDAVVGRGGLARPVESGVYAVNELMLEETFNARHKHACDLGCLIAHDIAAKIPQCQCFIADPGNVDELCDEARFSGSPLMPRICIWHALNQRAVGRLFARQIGRRYEELNLVICHLGGGISIAAHQHGRALDANNALDGEGPFSPERAGSLPAADLIRLCFSGRLTEEELLKRISGHAGLTAHLGSNDLKEILHRIEGGDDHARKVVDAMIFHTAKCIAAEGAVLCGKVDAVLLTGGMAYADYVVSRLKERVAFLAPVHVIPGEREMEALAMNALMVLRGEMVAKEYV